MPVIGKFLGFFLVPIYARVFSAAEFGIVELISTLVSFMVFACNLEMYSSIGRYFYEKEKVRQKGVLISTGLFLTFISSILVVILCFFFEDVVVERYIRNSLYVREYRFGVLWLFLNAVSTYLGIIPRYEKKSKLYVIVNTTSLLLRLCSTIFFVLVLKVGIIGVIYGHIVGDATSIIFNGIVSRRYLLLSFSKNDALRIIKYAFPLVPGLLAAGLWAPLSRNMTATLFSVSVLGLYAFASRFASLTSIFNGALRNTWQPMLFENIKNKNFVKDIRKIAGFSVVITVGIGTFLTLLSPELCMWIGTEKFADSSVLVGFLCLSGSFNVLCQIRGYGPLINNKTYINSIVNVIALLIGVLLFYAIKDKMGIIGLGIIMATYNFLIYILLSEYTRIKEKVMLYNIWELLLYLFLVISIFLVACNISFFYRILVLFIYIGVNLVIIHRLQWTDAIAKMFKRKR